MYSDPASFAQDYLTLEDRIAQCPRGTISKKTRRRKNGTLRLDYYFQFYSDGKRCEKYIRQTDVPQMLQQFEDKKGWKHQLREMNEFLQKLPRETRKRYRAAIALGREWNIVHAAEDALLQEKAEETLLAAAPPGTNVILPPAEIAAAGLHVRSRAEEMCLSIALEYDLQVRYEVPIEPDDPYFCIFPPYIADFEVTDPENGRRWIWEHLGMLDKKGYRDHQHRKLQYYQQIGLIRGQNLIITTSGRHVNKQMILWELIGAGAIDPCEARRHYRRERRMISQGNQNLLDP